VIGVAEMRVKKKNAAAAQEVLNAAAAERPTLSHKDGAVLATVSYADVLLLDGHEQFHAGCRRDELAARHTQRNHHVVECGTVIAKKKAYI
jgi:hypothetical protein